MKNVQLIRPNVVCSNGPITQEWDLPWFPLNVARFVCIPPYLNRSKKIIIDFYKDFTVVENCQVSIEKYKDDFLIIVKDDLGNYIFESVIGSDPFVFTIEKNNNPLQFAIYIRAIDVQRQKAFLAVDFSLSAHVLS